MTKYYIATGARPLKTDEANFLRAGEILERKGYQFDVETSIFYGIEHKFMRVAKWKKQKSSKKK